MKRADESKWGYSKKLHGLELIVCHPLGHIISWVVGYPSIVIYFIIYIFSSSNQEFQDLRNILSGLLSEIILWFFSTFDHVKPCICCARIICYFTQKRMVRLFPRSSFIKRKQNGVRQSKRKFSAYSLSCNLTLQKYRQKILTQSEKGIIDRYGLVIRCGNRSRN